MKWETHGNRKRGKIKDSDSTKLLDAKRGRGREVVWDLECSHFLFD